MMGGPSPQARDRANVLLGDFNDRFSAANRQRWFEYLGVEHETKVWHSKWSEHGYPFSSLDVNFGPSRLYLIQHPVAKKDNREGRKGKETGGQGQAGAQKSDVRGER
jgi:hypothetical protein